MTGWHVRFRGFHYYCLYIQWMSEFFHTICEPYVFVWLHIFKADMISGTLGWRFRYPLFFRFVRPSFCSTGSCVRILVVVNFLLLVFGGSLRLWEVLQFPGEPRRCVQIEIDWATKIQSPPSVDFILLFGHLSALVGQLGSILFEVSESHFWKIYSSVALPEVPWFKYIELIGLLVSWVPPIPSFSQLNRFIVPSLLIKNIIGNTKTGGPLSYFGSSLPLSVVYGSKPITLNMWSVTLFLIFSEFHSETEFYYLSFLNSFVPQSFRWMPYYSMHPILQVQSFSFFWLRSPGIHGHSSETDADEGVSLFGSRVNENQGDTVLQGTQDDAYGSLVVDTVI